MNLQNITFSVVIPNYNNGATLARAIDSLLSQTWPAHEIFVIDDGSTDDSAAVVARFGTKVRYFRQSNAGVSAARNQGARLATGAWLAFLDADDTYMPDRLEAHARWIMREPDLDFLFADQEHREPDGTLLQTTVTASAAGRRLVAQYPGRVEIPILPADFEHCIADGFNEIRTLSIPRATFLALGGFPSSHRVGEDLHFFIRMYVASRKGGVVNRPLAVYYIYPGSTLRKDPVAAQRAYIAAIEALADSLGGADSGIRRGWRAKLRQGRLSLAYMHLRRHERGAAMAAVAPLFLEHPSLKSLRDVISIMRGFS